MDYPGRVLARRRFLFLMGSAAPGLWLAGSGLVSLQRRFVVALGGACSFCGKDGTEIRALAGVTGRRYRICEGCVGLCCDILGETPAIVIEDADARRQPAPNLAEPATDGLDDLLRGLESAQTDLDAAMAEVRRRLDGERLRSQADFSCSFCDARRREVAKLISGPRVFICDACVGDAAGIVSHVVRA
jgi:ATP-dependent protease Clp ATPase subunit